MALIKCAAGGFERDKAPFKITFPPLQNREIYSLPEGDKGVTLIKSCPICLTPPDSYWHSWIRKSGWQPRWRLVRRISMENLSGLRQDEMTSAERMEALLKGKSIDRVPFFLYNSWGFCARNVGYTTGNM